MRTTIVALKGDASFRSSAHSGGLVAAACHHKSTRAEANERRLDASAYSENLMINVEKELQRAADMIEIHVNTMRQRLDAISAICPDWSEPNRGLELHMALRLHRLGETLPA